MQIHELNDFNGSLDSGAFIAVDNGTDTGKTSIHEIINPLNERIDNIIAGGDAPSEAEIIDARLGVNGEVYPSLGDAIRGQITDVNSELDLFEQGIADPIYTKTQATPTITMGKRLVVNGSELIETPDGSAAYMSLSVAPGETYFFTGRFTIYISGVFYLDGDTLLSYEHYNTTTENVVDYEISIPVGCNTLKINYGTSQPASLYVSEITGFVLKKSGILDDFIFDKTIQKVVAPTVVTGQRIYLNGDQTAIGTVADANGAYLTQAVDAGETYLFTGRFTIHISGIFYLHDNALLSFEHYNTSTENVVDYEINIPDGCNKLEITYSIAQPMTLKEQYEEPTLRLGGATKYWTVEPNGFGDFTSISAACADANAGDTIVVYPGTYREQVNIYGKELHIKGIDKHTCILIDSSSDYRTPPLMANWGSISNMTIIEDASDPAPGLENETYDGHPVKDMAYCIHSDSSDGIWTVTETEFVVEDCILINANRPGIGAGLYPYHSLIIRNCIFESGEGVVAGYKRGALYVHNNTSTNVLEQKIHISNNIIRCDDTIAVILYDTGGTGGCDVEIINNNVYSSVSGVADSIVSNDATPNDADFNLLPSSFGNNIASLNYA